MPCFPMFYASFCSRLMIRVMCSHACMTLFTYVYMFVSMPIYFDLCSHMSMCLDLCFL